LTIFRPLTTALLTAPPLFLLFVKHQRRFRICIKTPCVWLTDGLTGKDVYEFITLFRARRWLTALHITAPTPDMYFYPPTAQAVVRDFL
jgi:hypothetical protein